MTLTTRPAIVTAACGPGSTGCCAGEQRLAGAGHASREICMSYRRDRPVHDYRRLSRWPEWKLTTRNALRSDALC